MNIAWYVKIAKHLAITTDVVIDCLHRAVIISIPNNTNKITLGYYYAISDLNITLQPTRLKWTYCSFISECK